MMLAAGDLLPSDIGCTVALTARDSIRGRLDAIEPRLGGMLIDLTVDGRPFTVFADLLLNVDRAAGPRDVDALLRVNDALVNDLLVNAITRGRTPEA